MNHPTPTTIGLAQINDTYFGQEFLPYSVGLLQVYAEQHLRQPERFIFLPPLHQRRPLNESVAYFAEADIIGFSTYTWNMQRSLAVAQMLKIQRPDRLIIFGGPQVPDRAEEFLKAHPFVDVCCHGQGEAVFLQILESWPDSDWRGIAGISYLDALGHFMTRPKASRMSDLNQIPSPYLAGAFDTLMRDFPSTIWVAMWESNRGCPFSCTFCDWGSAVQSKIFTFDMARLYRELDWFGEHHIDLLIGCDANFGILPRDLELASYLANVKHRTGYPRMFYMNATKNATERSYAVHKILSDAKIGHQVTLSLQSLNPETLTAIQRDNISLDSFRELQQRFFRDKVDVYSDLILGLPGETYDSYVTGIEKTIASGQNMRIHFYDTMILPNAAMADPAYRQKHGLQTIFRTHRNNQQADWGDQIEESQEYVVATATMPLADMIRAKCFALWSMMLYYEQKPMQIPLLLLYQLTPLQHRQVIEAAMSRSPKYPLLNQIHAILHSKVAELLQGGTDKFTVTDEKGNTNHLLGDIYIFYWLLHDQPEKERLEQFYQEWLVLLGDLLDKHQIDYDRQLLTESIGINKAIFKMNLQEKSPQARFYFTEQPIQVSLHSNVCEYYQALLRGEDLPLQPESAVYVKNWLGPPYGLRKIMLAPTPEGYHQSIPDFPHLPPTFYGLPNLGN